MHRGVWLIYSHIERTVMVCRQPMNIIIASSGDITRVHASSMHSTELHNLQNALQKLPECITNVRKLHVMAQEKKEATCIYNHYATFIYSTCNIMETVLYPCVLQNAVQEQSTDAEKHLFQHDLTTYVHDIIPSTSLKINAVLELHMYMETRVYSNLHIHTHVHDTHKKCT